MKKHLFITGPIQTGKSTLLQGAVEPYREYIGGFVSQRLKNEKGETVGFRLTDYADKPALDATYDPRLSDIFMIHRDVPEVDLSVFETTGTAIIQAAVKNRKILLLDEIGGVELKSDIFRKALFEAFDRIPCIGVLKAPASAENMKANAEKVNAQLLDFMTKNGTIILSDKNWMHTGYISCIQNHIEEILG